MKIFKLVILLFVLLIISCIKEENKIENGTSEINIEGYWIDSNNVAVTDEIDALVYKFNMDGTVKIGYSYNFEPKNKFNTITSNLLTRVRKNKEIKLYFESNWFVLSNNVIAIEPFELKYNKTLFIYENANTLFRADKLNNEYLPIGNNEISKELDTLRFDRIQNLQNYQLSQNDLNGIWLHDLSGKAFDFQNGSVFRYLEYEQGNLENDFSEIPYNKHGVSNWYFSFQNYNSIGLTSGGKISKGLILNESGIGIFGDAFLSSGIIDDFGLNNEGNLNYLRLKDAAGDTYRFGTEFLIKYE